MLDFGWLILIWNLYIEPKPNIIDKIQHFDYQLIFNLFNIGLNLELNFICNFYIRLFKVKEFCSFRSRICVEIRIHPSINP